MGRKSIYIPLHHCTLENRLYAITFCAIFLLLTFHLTGKLSSEIRDDDPAYYITAGPSILDRRVDHLIDDGGVIDLDDIIHVTLPRNPPSLPSKFQKIRAPEVPEFERSVVNSHNFSFIINENEFCPRDGEDMFLLIVVASAVDHFDRRSAIRNTWGSSSKHLKLGPGTVKVLFLLGKPTDVTMQRFVFEEMSKYHDIIQEDFIDTYRNLTLKSVMALRWTTRYCPKTKFLMKTDDDVYVNLLLLKPYLKENRLKKKRWIVGCIKKHVGEPIQIKFGRAIPEPNYLTPTRGHPPFVAGAGYVISGDIVPELFYASQRIKYLPIEDVFVTAHTAKVIGVIPENEEKFTCGQTIIDECEMTSMFTGHHISAPKQYSIWSKVNGKNSECKGYKKS